MARTRSARWAGPVLALGLLCLAAWPHHASAGANDDLVAYMTKVCNYLASANSSQFCQGATTCACNFVDTLQSKSVRCLCVASPARPSQCSPVATV